MGSFFTFWGPYGLYLELGKGSNTVLESTHVVEQLLFSMFSSILTYDLDLILGIFLLIKALIGHVGDPVEKYFGVYSCS